MSIAFLLAIDNSYFHLLLTPLKKVISGVIEISILLAKNFVIYWIKNYNSDIIH